MKLFLILYDKTTKRTFKKFFKSEYEMDKFIQKLEYSDKLEIFKDSRDEYYDLYYK